MNKLPFEKKVRAISALVEGSSVRSVERMTGVHRDTILRLMVRVGDGCARLLDETMRGLKCERVQIDEVWAYCAKKQRHVTEHDDPSRVGDFWTYVAIDADTKLVPSHLVGKRDASTTQAFVADLASRVEGRIQLSSDMLGLYIEAVERGFGGAVDYGQIVKSYEAEPIGPGRYSPPKVVATRTEAIVGNPDPDHISTSFVERSNLTMRMNMRRFTRLTNAFSKKPENLRAAVALHFAHYNLARRHQTLRVTPAMAAGIADHRWTVADLVAISEGTNN